MTNRFDRQAVSAAIAAAFAVAPYPALAAEITAAGSWVEIDDETGKPGALIAIAEKNGVFQGTLTKIFVAPGEDPNPKCDKCPGARQGKPMTGLLLVDGMKRNGADYAGGEILDPESGQTYNATMRLSPDGEKLVVTGYAALSIFSESQTWQRDHSTPAPAPAVQTAVPAAPAAQSAPTAKVPDAQPAAKPHAPKR